MVVHLNRMTERAMCAREVYDAAKVEWEAAVRERKYEMRQAVTDGLTLSEVGAIFGVTKGYVAGVVAGRK